jgi:peptide/nickel transport system permease protein
MLNFIFRRILILIPLLFVISLITFILIELPPGDYLSTYIAQIESSTGERLTHAEIAQIRRFYGLDEPVASRYWKWITNAMKGDLGRSYEHNRKVTDILAERVPLTVLVSISSLLFAWLISVPVGVYSAIRQYSIFDYVFTFIGFIGLATPAFLLALVVMWLAFSNFGISATGLFSAEYADAPWSFAKVVDLLKHIWIPMIIIGMESTARLIRVMRGNLLDELRKQYVVTARAKGLKEHVLIFRYPVRVAINPLVSTIGWILPRIVSGGALVAIVLNLPTVGPVLLNSILSQDMYLAASIVLILSLLTIIGTLLSDILLAWLDPRIRFEGGSK